MLRTSLRILTILCAISLLAAAQTPAPAYQPKFPGDKAQSEAEAGALGYMRTVITAEKLYRKKHGQYAPSLAALVSHGSFTRRMTKTDRGDYVVHYKSKPDGYALALTPRQFDPAHRAFYADESGTIRAEDQRAANASSPPLK